MPNASVVPVDEKTVEDHHGQPNSTSSVLSGCSKSSIISVIQQDIRPIQVVQIVFAVVLPNVATVLLFSSMGRGVDVYNAMVEHDLSLRGDFLLCGSCFLAALLLSIDWWKMHVVLKVATSIIPIAMFYVGFLYKSRKYPWGPICLTLFFMVVGLAAVRMSRKNVKRRHFYGATTFITCLVAVIIGFLFIRYYSDGHQWNDQLMQDRFGIDGQDIYDNVYSERALVYASDCGPRKDAAYLDGLPKDQSRDIESACAQAEAIFWICWAGPMVAVGVDLLVSVFCYCTGVLGQFENVRSIQRSLVRFIIIIVFFVAGIYACTTMIATSVRLASTLSAFFLVALALVLAVVFFEVDPQALKTAASSSKLMKQLLDLAQSDWVRAVFVAMLGIPMAVFFCLNYLCQRYRICRGHVDAGKEHDPFTSIGMKVLEVCKKMNWTSIFVKIILLAELFFVLQVGVAKITYIFLSWLNQELRIYDMGTVCIIVYIVGGFMFLLPPVPGLPVYVFAGILIGKKGEDDERIGFWLGSLIAMALGLFTKLCACCGQYMIGYYMGKSIKVQQLIGVDKVPTRAIERVLKTRGLNPGKVAILVGGPDWPTSVTCGIIKVNIPQMLLGTLPVIILLAPCILCGAFMSKVEPGMVAGPDIMLANAFTAMAALVNMVGMAYAVYTISDTVQKYGDELAKPREEHKAVQELTKAEEQAVECYARVTAWDKMSLTWKAILFTSTALSFLSNAIFVFLAESCFRPFSVSSRIADPFEKHGLRDPDDPDDKNGKPTNIIIHPVGTGALGLFVIAVLLHVLFVKVMARKARRQLVAEGHRPPRVSDTDVALNIITNPATLLQ